MDYEIERIRARWSQEEELSDAFLRVRAQDDIRTLLNEREAQVEYVRDLSATLSEQTARAEAAEERVNELEAQLAIVRALVRSRAAEVHLRAALDIEGDKETP